MSELPPNDVVRSRIEVLAPSQHVAGNTLLAQEKRHLDAAVQASPDYCFPSGLDHLDLLHYGIARRPQSARLHAYLGNVLFHHRRPEEATANWQRSAELDGSSSKVW